MPLDLTGSIAYASCTPCALCLKGPKPGSASSSSCGFFSTSYWSWSLVSGFIKALSVSLCSVARRTPPPFSHGVFKEQHKAPGPQTSCSPQLGLCNAAPAVAQSAEGLKLTAFPTEEVSSRCLETQWQTRSPHSGGQGMAWVKGFASQAAASGGEVALRCSGIPAALIWAPPSPGIGPAPRGGITPGGEGVAFDFGCR